MLNVLTLNLYLNSRYAMSERSCSQFPDDLTAGTVIQGKNFDTIHDQNVVVINSSGEGSVVGTYIAENAETNRVIKGGSTTLVFDSNGERENIIAGFHHHR
uniref:uncharacterized protein LOC120335941 n=1 Tax=Styela clava TaxID=7725 RepID=UPI001939635D|nr:uncharacterized protein LOC120335941 [Styela clava]